MALKNLVGWNTSAHIAPVSACGAADPKPSACGAAEPNPTACGSACGAGDKK